MGSWSFVREYIEEIMEDVGTKQTKLKYAGRASAASPATGNLGRHNDEQAALIAAALGFNDAAEKSAAK
jgi:2-oxoglutarate dehydrogenase E1 component